MDAVNAGSGFYVGANVPNFPVGLTVVNNSAGASCYNAGTNTYSAGCFDKLNIITVDPNTSPAHPDNGSNGCALTTNAALFLTPQTGTTVAQLAAAFHLGDQILFIKGDGSQLTTATLTAAGVVVGTKVQLQHTGTNADGTNTSGNDPLDISTHANPKLGTSFCPADWVLKLAGVTYTADTTNPTNPQLIRTQSGTSAVIADQIVGFKVGVAIYGAGGAVDVYNYDASTYAVPYDFTSVRSVRISLIGRTPPNGTQSYRNSFDNGPYKIEPMSIVIDPRNLSMRD
jgi:hypothetical protein